MGFAIVGPQHEQDDIRLEIHTFLKVRMLPVRIVGRFLHGIAAGAVVFDLVVFSQETLESGWIRVFGNMGNPCTVGNTVAHTGDPGHLAALTAKTKESRQSTEDQRREEKCQFCFQFHISTSFEYYLEYFDI